MSDNGVIIYGLHAVTLLLSRQPERISLIVIDQERHDSRVQKIKELAQVNQIKVKLASKLQITHDTKYEHHQGVIAYITPLTIHQDIEQLLDRVAQPFLLILDGIQDPHNLGACLRSANAAGVDAVIAPKDRAVGITSVVSKVASGATFFTPFYQVTNLVRTIELLKERRIWIYGASEHATSLYNEVDLTGCVAIVMGSEGKGLRRLTEQHCDFLIRIPMLGTVPSLNVSVATGVCLFEVVRQRLVKVE
jgi:23S rRNA (guanosine2251-2'-O)-methyltransferase